MDLTRTGLVSLTLILWIGCAESGATGDGGDATMTDAPETTTVADADPDATGTSAEADADHDDGEVAGCLDCAAGCCGARCCAVEPSQGVLTSLADGQGAFTIAEDLTFDTGAACGGDTALGRCEHVRLDDVIVVCVCRLATLTVDATLTVVGSDGLVVLAADAVTVDGVIDVSAVGARHGPGGGWSYDGRAAAREGGAGGSFGSEGGDGRPLLGTDDLQPLTSGCAGQGTEAEPTLGGGRGGALQISAGRAVTITGALLAHGGGGRGGALAGGGGGGSGGAILVEAPTVRVTGAIAAHGGGGGGGAGDVGPGGDGQDGRAGAIATGGASGVATQCEAADPLPGGAGGDGAAGATPATRGAAGGSDEACGPERWSAAGGAGGGDGRVVIRTRGGCDCSGTVSPEPRHFDLVIGP